MCIEFLLIHQIFLLAEKYYIEIDEEKSIHVKTIHSSRHVKFSHVSRKIQNEKSREEIEI